MNPYGYRLRITSYNVCYTKLLRYKSKDVIDRQIAAHSALRRELTDSAPGLKPDLRRDAMVELLLRILFMDHAISRSIGSLPPAAVVDIVGADDRAGDFSEEIIFFIGAFG